MSSSLHSLGRVGPVALAKEFLRHLDVDPLFGGVGQHPAVVAQAHDARRAAVEPAPGEYALGEVAKALNAGLHCVVFSNNVPLADERKMKELAREKGLLCMGPDCGDTATCADAQAVAEKYQLKLSADARACLARETPKALSNVETRITGSVRELCAAAAEICRARGYEPVLLTDRLDCEAREAGRFLADIARTHAGGGQRLAFLAGGETVVHLTGHGLGGRNQELALAAAPGIAGLRAAVFSVGSDGTDGPTDAAGGYVDGETLAALTAKGLAVPAVLAGNDAYHALQAVDGLIVTGPTGTNVNDVAVALVNG